MKNKLCSPSFSQYSNCRIIIDCTDVEIATLKLLHLSWNELFQGDYRSGSKCSHHLREWSVSCSLSDKSIVQEAGLLEHFVPGDLILIDKGFLIQNLLPRGVSENIPPFPNYGKFTES